MWRMCVLALLGNALVVPAWSDPLLLHPNAYGIEPAPTAAPVAPSRTAPAAPAYRRVAQTSLGGGFIEFLFGGAGGEAPRPPASSADAYPASDVRATGAPQAVAYGIEPAQRASSGEMSNAGHPPVDTKFDRQIVPYETGEGPGTIIIDTPHKFLYLVEGSGKAIRYGIGVGRPGFTWAGVKTITAKHEWPDWRPPEEMLQRQPQLPRFMAGGPENPLGARAMYLGSTLYRIHGSNEPWTIGTNVSSGCIRMRNADVIDLYDRVKVGTKVVVM